MSTSTIPLTLISSLLGPGSQEEEETLEYLSLPKDMRTYTPPVLPEPEDIRDRQQLKAWFAALLVTTEAWQVGQPAIRLAMQDLSPADREVIDQVLGEGEVSAQIARDGGRVSVQESVFAGVWRLRGFNASGLPTEDYVEVGAVPAMAREAAAQGLAAPQPAAAGPGVINAVALLAEITEQVGLQHAEPHVINLSLLPFSPEDASWLDARLGRGQVTFLSRGYGNCRVTATGIARVWWVQYFNSQDALILNTLEISDMPEVAQAAGEDLQDTSERLREVLEWIDC
ncbi:MAG: hydrogenase expression/formation protein [Xanthomonadales bacterium]|jgi:hydrogenase-1 operon protein HyaF|nr:hydrogenase expression/formation protein [Xanthomonadales bacterium]